jgi:nicotinamide-nucleotide amidase
MIETFADALPADIHHLATVLMAEACARQAQLAVAESCTGGLLAAVMTDVEGCAHAFDRGFVAYTDAAKQSLLGVPADLLARHTAVSAQAAAAMAQGALANSQADIALSVTGFAGAGAPGEEPGLVFFGVARRHLGHRVVERHFGDGSRSAVRLACLRTALELMRQALDQPWTADTASHLSP